jgi:hypothetical protein
MMSEYLFILLLVMIVAWPLVCRHLGDDLIEQSEAHIVIASFF